MMMQPQMMMYQPAIVQQPMFGQIPLATPVATNVPPHYWSLPFCAILPCRPALCFVSCCCMPCRWQTTMSRASLLDPRIRMSLFWLWTALVISSCLFGSSYYQFAAYLVFLFCMFMIVVVGCYGRHALRSKYGIPGSNCEDCLNWFPLCQCCSVAQEAHYVDTRVVGRSDASTDFCELWNS
jgi:Cys-rich protein (TIGR01571 family)